MIEQVEKFKYTDDVAATIAAKYKANPTRECVDEIAESLNVSVRSVVGKLAKMGVYQRPEYKTKTGEAPITKEELVRLTEKDAGLPDLFLDGLEKCPKHLIRKIYKLLCEEYDDGDGN